jgi:hypothetical protein
MRKTLLVGWVLPVSGKAALGQHLGELTANYSYMHYVPVDNLPTANLNGGGGSAVLYFAGSFGLKAEVEGYASQNINFNFPPGSIRCPSGWNRAGKPAHWEFRATNKNSYQARAAFNFYQNVHKNCSRCTFGSPGDWALDVVLGGGLDIKVTSHLAIRPIEADYFLTHFINNLTTGNNNQNNFRYQAGLVFEF